MVLPNQSAFFVFMTKVCCKPLLNSAQDKEEIQEATAVLICLCGIKENWSHLESVEEIWCQCGKLLCFADWKKNFIGHTYIVTYSKIFVHCIWPIRFWVAVLSARGPDLDHHQCIWLQALTGKLAYNTRLCLGWSRKLFSAEKQILPGKSKLCCLF